MLFEILYNTENVIKIFIRILYDLPNRIFVYMHVTNSPRMITFYNFIMKCHRSSIVA